MKKISENSGIVSQFCKTQKQPDSYVCFYIHIFFWLNNMKKGAQAYSYTFSNDCAILF